MNLNQVTLPSVDLLRSIPFYEMLGLRLIVDSRPRYARFLLPEGNATLSLHHVDRVASDGTRVKLYFECEDLQGEVERLKANGVVFESDPQEQRWLWQEAWFRDPDGHQLCLFKAGENRTNPPWRVAGS